MGEPRLRILLVEGDSGVARQIRAHLTDAGTLRAKVAAVPTLDDARRSIPDSAWDVVLLDLDLPDSRGIATFRAVRELLPATPIVVLTDIEGDAPARDAVRAGARDSLPKGALSVELLSRTIRYAIERERTERRLDEERDRLFAVLDALPMFVYLQSPDHTIPFANRTFRELFGDVEGRPCDEVFHGNRRPCGECPSMRVQETGEPEISEWTSPAGRTYAIYDQAFPGPSGTPLTLEVGLDITEQKRAQEQLAKSEARFRRLAENAPDVIYRYRIIPKPRFDYISPAVTRISGYTPKEYYADPLLGVKVAHPDDRHLLEGFVHGRLPAQRTLDVRWIRKDGEVRWIEDHHIPIYDDAGKPVAIEGVARDTTEWKWARQALAESEERYRLLFEHAGIGIGYYTPDGVLIGYNRVAAAHMGGVPEDFAGKSIRELFGDEKGAEYRQRIIDAVRTSKTATYEDCLELPTGSRWFRSTYSRVGSPNGEAVGVQILSEEITDRKTSEAALRESERRFRELSELLPEVIYECDLTGRVTFANRIAFGRFGYTEDDLERGVNVLQMIAPRDRDRVAENIRRILNGERVDGTEYTALARDGSTFPVIVHSSVAFQNGEPAGLRGLIIDISDQQRAREALRTADEVVSAIPTGILIYQYREPGEILLVSGNAAAASVVDVEANKGKGLESHWPTPMVERLKAPLLAIAREGGAYGQEAVVGSSPDASRALDMRAFRISGDRVVIAFEDITERRRAEAELRESEERYRSLFENAILGIYQTTPDGRILAANPALVRMLGYGSFAELAKRNLEEEGYEAETPREEFKERLERLGSLAGRESAWKRRDGTTLYIRENARVVRDEAGNVLYYEGTIEDITERKNAEREAESLRAQLELTQHSIDSTDAVVLWVLPDGHLTFVNEAACRMLGYTHDELLGMAVWDIDEEYPQGRRSSAWEELKRARSEVSESTFRTKSGETFPVEITAQYLEFHGRELEFAVAFDISKRKRLEAQLRQSQRLESIGTLASGVAHEINNPLTGIINYAKLIGDRIEDPKLRKYADGIKEEGDRVAKIVRNLLSFSRQKTEHHSPARMIDIVNASLSLYTALLRRDGIDLRIDVPEDLPQIECRSQEIQQVIINLLTNARDSLNLRFPAGDEDKRIAIRARVLREDGKDWIRLTVEDSGRGIPPEVIGRVFDPFFTTKSRDQGTGLGLSISYGLVRDHGGRMTVESVPDKRTRFFVDLPSNGV